jgi:hypothetical protein
LPMAPIFSTGMRRACKHLVILANEGHSQY